MGSDEKQKRRILSLVKHVSEGDVDQAQAQSIVSKRHEPGSAFFCIWPVL